MATTRLEKTFTASNRKTFTISTWIKRSALTVNNCIYSAGTNDSTDRELLVFLADAGEEDKLYFNAKVSNSTVAQFYTSRQFRDVGAFYHIVLAFDTTQATDTNRMKLYVNGELQTFQSVTYPNQNRDMNTNNTVHKIGSTVANGQYFNGLMSYFAFVDGTQYDPSYFGETDSSSGIWKWKSPSVTYGTNGFFLKMDTSSPGTDTSGNSNTFTASGTPTLTQDNASNNLATMNPLDNYYQGSIFSNGNNTFLTTDVSTTYNTSSIMVNTGKWYVECKVVSGSATTNIGIVGEMADATTGQIKAKEFGYAYISNGEFGNNGSASSYGSSYANGDIIGIALDCTNNKLYFSKNGTFQDSGNPSAGSGGKTITAVASTTLGLYTFAACDTSNGDVRTFSFNFGNGFFGTTAVASSNADAAGHGLFEYAVPTGFFTLNTKNLNTYGG